MGQTDFNSIPSDFHARSRFTATANASQWFFVPKPRPDARLRVFCFPYAGGWPWAFRAWSNALPPHIELATVCLPGRGKRAQEAPALRVDALVSALVEVMRPRLDKPYVLFGHSLGAVIAYELAGALARAGAPAPLRLFLSGSPAPSQRVQRKVLHRLSDRELVAAIRGLNGTPSLVLDDPDLLAVTLPLIRADFALGETHQLRTQALDCPVTVFFGTSDPHATRETVSEWRSHARGPFAVRSFPGDHFFLHEHADRVLAALQEGVL